MKSSVQFAFGFLFSGVTDRKYFSIVRICVLSDVNLSLV